MRYAVAPLLSDSVPVLLSLLAAQAMPDRAARLLAVVGGAFVIYLGVLAFRDRNPQLGQTSANAATGDYLRGALTNALNPHPWIFWLGAGAPLLRAAWMQGGAYAGGWLGLFYLGLVGSKLGLALAIGQGRRHLAPRYLVRLIIGSAAVMMVVGAWLMWQGVTGAL
jgi:threonine/homoserine/homoserine lactone efflux protein